MENKGNWFVIASLLIVPISGAFSTDVWDMQLKVLIVICVIGAIIGISYIKNYKSILNGIIVLCAVQGVLVVLQTLGLDPFFNPINGTKDLPFGFSGSPNQSGLFFGVTLPLIIAYAHYLLPLHLFALLMAKTTSATVGAVIGVLFLFHKSKKVWLILAIALLLFLWKGDPISPVAYKERFQVWEHSLKAVVSGEIKLLNNNKIYRLTCNPLTGFGSGSFKRLSPYNQNIWINKGKGNHELAGHRYFHAHNDYIEFFFEYGWLGLCSLLFILGNAIYRYIRTSNTKRSKILKVVTACLIAQAVSALGIFTVNTATSAMMLIINYGMFIGITRKDHQNG